MTSALAGILTSITLVAPGTADAQLLPGGGTLGLYSNAGYTDSTYQDSAVQSFTVYVVHRDITFASSNGIRFKVEPSPGATFSWVSDSSPMLTVVGDSQSGVTILYGACLFPDPGLILTIEYIGFGTSEPCSYLGIVSHPDAASGEIEVTLCVGLGPVSAIGRTLQVSCPIPVGQTTWGRVKSLYR